MDHEMDDSHLDATSASSHILFQDRLSSIYQPVTPSISFSNRNSIINKDKLQENKLIISVSPPPQSNNDIADTRLLQHEYLEPCGGSNVTTTKDGSYLSASPDWYTTDSVKTASAPNQQFIFKKPVYDRQYHRTHYNHLERHGSHILKDLKRLFSPRRNTRLLTVPSDTLHNESDQESTSSIGSYCFGNEFNKDLKHHYGKWDKVIGEGSGGSVCVIHRAKDDKVFAVKSFRKRESQETERDYVKKVTAEFCIGSMLHHDNIIETLDIIREGSSSFYQIMEYAPYDMFTIVMNTHLAPEEMDCCWRQLLNGVAYLHQMGIAHRDLKLDNLVMDERNIVKIIDFGTATVVRYPYEKQIRLAKGIHGSDPYIAPEQYSQPHYNAFLADVWSCGIIFVCMKMRRFAWCVPRPAMDPNYEMYLHDRNSLLAYIPRYARPTIANVLEPSPQVRLDLASLLLDPWVASIETCTPHRHYQHHQPLPPCPNIIPSYSPHI